MRPEHKQENRAGSDRINTTILILEYRLIFGLHFLHFNAHVDKYIPRNFKNLNRRFIHMYTGL